jgi:serine/threonine protein kinase
MIAPGTLLQNRYRVVKQIGQGGMGAVYVATDERFHSTVAVKQTLFDDPALRKAFEREAQLLNHLRHAALPKVSDHFIEDDGQFLVMEFIEGSDLSDLLTERNGAFPVADVLQWADELLNALDYLHTQTPPIIHRDIKPQNLKLTTRGQIVLLDFGLAKGTPAQMHASTTASIFGYSRSYAPLEQIQGTGTDARSDLYSLGATLYHLLTGAAPVDALTRASAIVNNQPDPLKPAHLVRAEIPAAVGGVLHRAMAQNAALRPQTAAALRAALRQAAQSAHDTSPQAAATRSTAYDEATMLDPSSLAPEGQAPDLATHRAARVSTQMHRTVATPPGEVSVTRDARQHVRPRTDRTHVAAAPPEPPARKSHKLLVAVALAVLVACAAVPFVLTQRAATPTTIKLDAQPTDAPTATDAQTGTSAAPVQADGAQSGSLSATESAPAQTSAPAARPVADAQTNAASSTTDAAASANAAGTNAGSDATGGLSSGGNTSAGSGGLEIHNPAPGPEVEARRLEDMRRAAEARRAEEMRRAEEARRAEEFQRRQMEGPPPPPPGGPPFGGGQPPPPGGRRPPPY